MSGREVPAAVRTHRELEAHLEEPTHPARAAPGAARSSGHQVEEQSHRALAAGRRAARNHRALAEVRTRLEERIHPVQAEVRTVAAVEGLAAPRSPVGLRRAAAVVAGA